MKRYVNPNVHKNIIYKCQKRKQIKCSSTDEWMKKCAIYIYIAAFQSLSHVQLFVTHRLQHIRLLCPPLSPRVCSDSCLFSHWCYLTISSSAAPFFFCPQSFPASGSVPMMWLFTSGGQSIGASVLASVLPMNIQDWFPLALSGFIPLKSKGLSRVFSNTTVLKHQLWHSAFFMVWIVFHKKNETKGRKFCHVHNMVEFGGRYAKWNKSDRERQILYHYQLYVKSKKLCKLVNIRKKKQTHRYTALTTGYWWGEGRGYIGEGVKRYKLLLIK